jgi:hypothetical protein
MARLEWQCIGHHPTKWALGNVADSKMSNVLANVTRDKDGSWLWVTLGGWSGREPSRIAAIEAAEQSVKLDGSVCTCAEFVQSAFDPSRCAVCRKTRPATYANR